MRLFKNLAVFAAILAGTGCSVVWGQTTVPSSRFRPVPAESPSATAPLTEPWIYDYDAQMFASYDLRDLADPGPPCGFYATYDRLYTNVERPAPQPGNQQANNAFVPTGSDYMWGNRFELGVINENGRGWGGEYYRTAGSFFSAGEDVLVSNPFLTNTTVNSFELNRMFRQSVQTGGWFDPYFGFRFMGVTDDTLEDSTIGGNPNRFKQTATNSCWGGQVGARYARRFGRFGVALDGAMIASYNGQHYKSQDLTTIGASLAIVETYDDGSDFAPAVDLRGDFSYLMTRDISFRLTTQMLYIWDGVNRANTLPSIFNPNSSFGPPGLNGVTSEDFVTAGFGFGIEWRR
jgi:hypothetical protein